MATAITTSTTNPVTFTVWLIRKLISLGLDESVYGNYIQSILESDITSDEKRNEISEILSEIVEDDQRLNDLCYEIETKWLSYQNESTLPKECSNAKLKEELLMKLVGSQKLTKTKEKMYTAEEKRLRDAILSQYSQMTDNEDEEDGDDTEKNDLERNKNLQTVIQAEKVKREQAKQESQKKKEKDKEDREKQKQLKEEKKEKRKTQKNERRR